jgi:hypothetical protein
MAGQRSRRRNDRIVESFLDRARWRRAVACLVGTALACLPAMAIAGRADAASPITVTQADATMNFTLPPTDRLRLAYGVDGGCFDIDTASGPAAPRRWGALTCTATAPSTPHELKFDRGEASWRLGILGVDQHNLSEIRSAFSLEHFLALGPLGGWQLHGDVSVGHPTSTGSGLPIDEGTHVSMSRGLPWGCNLRLGASATAQGALDPGVAGEQNSEVAAELSRDFNFDLREADHHVSLKLAEQSAVNRLFGIDQRTMLAGFTYGHALTTGSVAATVTFTHVEPVTGPIQDAARAEMKFSRRF